MQRFKNIPRESPLVIAGTITAVLALAQMLTVFSSLLQYFCLFDFLRGFKTLVFMKVLYYNNPRCGTTINIGEVVPEIRDAAFVFTNSEPATTTRTVIVNSVYLSLSMMWILSSVMLVVAGASKFQRFGERVFWMIITGIIVIFDTGVVIMYATDIPLSKTSTSLVNFAGATLSGAGNVVVDTKLVPIAMATLYSRCGIFYFINIFLLIWILYDTGVGDGISTNSVTSDDVIVDIGSTRDGVVIPRASLLKRLPSWLVGHHEPSPTLTYEDFEMSYRPRRLANLMAERRAQLTSYVIDTSMRSLSRSEDALPDSFETPTTVEIHAPPPPQPAGRRGTAAELQGQLPWSYIPPSAHRMRDNLPEDEDLPPVPVPDYTLHPKYRKASLTAAGPSSGIQREHVEEPGSNDRASSSRTEPVRRVQRPDDDDDEIRPYYEPVVPTERSRSISPSWPGCSILDRYDDDYQDGYFDDWDTYSTHF